MKAIVGVFAVLGASAVASGCGVERGTFTGAGPDASAGAPADGDGGTGVTASPDGGRTIGSQGPEGPLATGMTITEVAVFQAVKIDVMKAGAAVTTRKAPVVAGRDAFVRVFVQPDATYTPRALTAQLRLARPGPLVLESTRTLTAASTDAASGSTFDFDVPGGSLSPDVAYSVALTDPALSAGATDGTSARFPATGTQSLGVKSDGETLKVVVVPVRYDADGSKRLPAIDAAQVEAYRQAMYRMYPAARVEVTVRAPYPWAAAIGADGTGFEEVLLEMTDLRQRDGAADDVYYFGAFAPFKTFDLYCQTSCVMGLSGVGSSPDDVTVRASVGVGFAGPDATITMAHEVGHAHGELHSPCGGAGDPDPKFPYSGGTIGDWGYDLLARTLVDPSSGKDLMGYCDPVWISDYTYNRLFARMAYVNSAARATAAFTEPRPYRFVRVAGDGSLAWGRSITLARPPSGEAHTAEFASAEGAVIGREAAHFYAYDHLPGGYLLVPEATGAEAASTQVTFRGPRVARAIDRARQD
jgi:hypothetical protein